MYTGTMIEDLIAMVERAEVRAQKPLQTDELEYWYAASQRELTQLESGLMGAA
jgi:hypothetical protein